MHKLCSLLFVCFALNSVEAREGMPLLLFLDENRGNIIGGTTFSCLVNVFLFQFKVHRCSGFFLKAETQESPQFSPGFPDKER